VIRVAIGGPRGKMGQEAVHTIMNDEHFELVGVLDYKDIGQHLSESTEFPDTYTIPVYLELKELLELLDNTILDQ